ncbi:MAG: hypothetical protein EOP33_08930 [Rickettsiaceae bacterium]|nr:MAG: hypothetical protein EOP33_08930 [Rickettsiaceae bacterium]
MQQKFLQYFQARILAIFGGRLQIFQNFDLAEMAGDNIFWNFLKSGSQKMTPGRCKNTYPPQSHAAKIPD